MIVSSKSPPSPNSSPFGSIDFDDTANASIRKHSFQRARYLKLIAYCLIFGSTIIGLLVGEASLQLFYRLQEGEWLWQNSAFRIGYTQPVSDRRQYVLRPEYQDLSGGLSIDTQGFRSTASNAVNMQMIVCLGDSVPFGAGVRDEETYSSYLASKLDSANVGIGVLNAGVPSYNLRQSFDRLRKDVLARHPPERIHLVTVDAANDISLLTYYGPGWSPELTWAEVRWSGNWGKPFYRKLATFHYLRRFLNLLSSDKLGTPIYAQPVPSYEPKRKEMFEHIHNTLQTELASLREMSIPVILMPINPFYYQISRRAKNESLRKWKEWMQFVNDWDQLITEYNDMLSAISREMPGVYFLDTRPVMDSQDRDVLYVDFIHYSPEGNRLLADTLFEFLMKEGMVTPMPELMAK